MIQYSADGKTAIYGGYKFRKDPNTGYYLCTRKTDCGKRERLHVYVWRSRHGPIPFGYHVHHRDENKDNNEPDNLECIPEFDHLSLHGKERAALDHDRIVKNLAEKARPRASEWHRSPEGRKWHSQHGKEVMAGLQPVEFVCEMCGKHFLSLPNGKHRFCSNACKTKARVASGVDNETRVCAYCGKEFEANKYGKQRYCSKSCGHKSYWDKKRQAAGRGAGL